eukprot:753476-Hanusia_phi.AAC.7
MRFFYNQSNLNAGAPLVPFFVGFNKVLPDPLTLLSLTRASRCCLHGRRSLASISTSCEKGSVTKLKLDVSVRVSEKDVIGDDTMKLKTQTMMGKPV